MDEQRKANLETLVAKGLIGAGIYEWAEIVRSLNQDDTGLNTMVLGITAGLAYFGKKTAEFVGKNRQLSQGLKAADNALFQGYSNLFRNKENSTHRPLIRSAVIAGLFGLAAYTFMPSQPSQPLQLAPVKPVATIAALSAPATATTVPPTYTPTPEPTATPTKTPTKTPTPPVHYTLNINQQEINFLERVVYGEVAMYHPSRRSNGYTVEEHEKAITEQAQNIANVIGNRTKHPKFITSADEPNYLVITLGTDEFSTVWERGMRNFFFNPNAPAKSELERLGLRTFYRERDNTRVAKGPNQKTKDMRELIKYANTSQLTLDELRTYAESEEDFRFMKKKFELVVKGVQNYVNGWINPKNLWYENVIFYLNPEIVDAARKNDPRKNPTDDPWEKKCLGTTLLEKAGDDPPALRRGYRHPETKKWVFGDSHRYYREVGQCNLN